MQGNKIPQKAIQDHNRSLKGMLGPRRPQMAVKTQRIDFVTLNSRLSDHFEAIFIVNIFCSFFNIFAHDSTLPRRRITTTITTKLLLGPLSIARGKKKKNNEMVMILLKSPAFHRTLDHRKLCYFSTIKNTGFIFLTRSVIMSSQSYFNQYIPNLWHCVHYTPRQHYSHTQKHSVTSVWRHASCLAGGARWEIRNKSDLQAPLNMFAL